ncbi:unnamed protein product [Taenia asiatica]|uniref:Transmembrane protein n=1 Tax=Taenia asiatica TaxID=60517 RepID=A0A0R3W6X4_TAEAS|nr:unnamed protein product [Taenia asiatica]
MKDLVTFGEDVDVKSPQLATNDWSIVYGSPTKLCLGLFSIAFDCGFFIQHHLYRGRTASTEALVEVDTDNSEAPTVNESANADVHA